MCANRKYQTYKIKITYNNGDTEDINLKGINSSSYSEMLKVYKTIKEEHKEDSCIIDFLGESDNGGIGILFTKEINIKTSSEELESKAIDIGLQIEKLLELLVKKKEYHNPIVSAESKSTDLLLHKIEYIVANNMPISLEEKASMIDELGNIRSKRRFHKTENYNCGIYFHYMDINFVLNKIKEINEIVKNGKGTTIDFSEETLKQYNIIAKKIYKTEKERISLMSQWKPKYDKVVVDESEKSITAFNYGYTCNKNKKVI